MDRPAGPADTDGPPRPSRTAAMPRPAAALPAFLLLTVAGAAAAGSITTKAGVVHRGTIQTVRGITEDQLLPPAGADPEKPNGYQPLMLVDTLTRRVWTGRRNVADSDPSAELGSGRVRFTLNPGDPEPPREMSYVGTLRRASPFSPHGRRTLTVGTADGETEVVQMVKELSSEGLELISPSVLWRSALDVSAVPPEQLAAMIATDVDPENPDDRLAVVRFYTEAGLLTRAGAELDGVRRDFPELSAAADAAADALRAAVGAGLLADLLVRQAAGQHATVRRALAGFPTAAVPPETARRINDLRAEYADLDRRIGLARVRFDMLHGGLEEENRDRFAPYRPEIAAAIGEETVGRLDPFLQFADDDSLPAAERLALAYSGWAAGPGGATTDIEAAAGLWRARRLLGEYLAATDPLRAAALADELAGLESADVLAVRSVVPRLRPWLETNAPAPGPGGLTGPFVVTCDRGFAADAAGGGPPSYSVVLPPEYDPDRPYPSLVVLCPYGTGAEPGARFWGVRTAGGDDRVGPATAAGYVVIAVDLEPTAGRPAGGRGGHPYGDAQVEAVAEIVEDARRRFALDPDRCCLTGHWSGADAAVDVALSRPDLFACAAVVGGRLRKFADVLERNAVFCPLYVVGGQLDPAGPVRDASTLKSLMYPGGGIDHDVTYVEYFGRGRELFAEEVPRMLDWFAVHRRTPYPSEFEAAALRPSASRRWWVEAGRFPDAVLAAGQNPGRGRAVPLTVEAEVRDRTRVRVKCGAKPVTVLLSPELIDYQQRIDVRINTRRATRGFLKPDVRVLIEDLRAHADRSRTYTSKLSL